MQTTIPAELLELKARFDQWRANRKYKRELMPADLRQAAIDISRRYPRALVRRLLKIDLWRLSKPTSKKSAPAAGHKKQQTAFFTFPTYAVSPDQGVTSSITTDCRLQFERPDGARLTLSLPKLDLVSINRLAADFLRGNQS
jgi:hypothetical protein